MRGFGTKYIKDCTGISSQSLLARLRAKGVVISKEDVINYQVEYIEERYTLDDIAKAYRSMMYENNDPYELRRGKHLHYLGCGFGDYPKVFRILLGEAKYKELRNECWRTKQVASVREKYGVDNVFEKSVFHTFVSDDAIAKGRESRTQTLIERYGVEHPNQNAEIAARMVESSKETFMKKYGVDHPMKLPENAMASAEQRQRTMRARYGAGNSVEIKEIREKIFEARRINGTFSSSRSEDALYVLLDELFDDVQRNVIVDSRYPWHVDFYVPSRDLFIELNGDPAHNDHWFDANSEKDQKQVALWMSKSVTRPRYSKMLEIWTKRDVMKRNTAKKYDLNYLVFWDTTLKSVNGVLVPKLSDVHAWISDGCPDSKDWNKENTY